MSSKARQITFWSLATIFMVATGYFIIWIGWWTVFRDSPFPAFNATLLATVTVWVLMGIFGQGLIVAGLAYKRRGWKGTFRASWVEAMQSPDRRWSVSSRLFATGVLLFTLFWEIGEGASLVLRGEGIKLSDVPILVFYFAPLVSCGLLIAVFELVARQGGWEQAMQSWPDGRWSLARRMLVASALFGSVFLVGALLSAAYGQFMWIK